MTREMCVGNYMVIEEPSGEATVYNDDVVKFQKEFASYDEALAWATEDDIEYELSIRIPSEADAWMTVTAESSAWSTSCLRWQPRCSKVDA